MSSTQGNDRTTTADDAKGGDRGMYGSFHSYDRTTTALDVKRNVEVLKEMPRFAITYELLTHAASEEEAATALDHMKKETRIRWKLKVELSQKVFVPVFAMAIYNGSRCRLMLEIRVVEHNVRKAQLAHFNAMAQNTNAKRSLFLEYGVDVDKGKDKGDEDEDEVDEDFALITGKPPKTNSKLKKSEGKANTELSKALPYHAYDIARLRYAYTTKKYDNCHAVAEQEEDLVQQARNDVYEAFLRGDADEHMAAVEELTEARHDLVDAEKALRVAGQRGDQATEKLDWFT